MKIVVFSPFSLIKNHSFPERAIIKSLLEGRNQVIRVSCSKELNSYCNSMETLGLELNSKRNLKFNACEKCIQCSGVINKSIGLLNYSLKDLISKKKILEIEEYVSKIKKVDLKSHFNNINLNKEALYQVILKFKLKNTELTNDALVFFKNELKNCLICYHAGSKFQTKIKVQAFIGFNIQYGTINSFYKGVSYKNKIKSYTINGSNNNFHKNSLLRFWDWGENKLLHPAKNFWRFYDAKKLPKESFKIAMDHAKTLHGASSPNIYSPKKSKVIHEKLKNLSVFKKKAVLTMSSYDEAYSAYLINAYPEYKFKSNVFKNQIEWIDYTIKLFSKLEDWALIIRVHPRELNNKKKFNPFRNNINSNNDGIKSDHFFDFMHYMDSIELPKNVIFNLPNDEISLYNIFDFVDLCISNTSVTVVEALYHNIPVVVYDNKMTNYPDDLIYSSKSLNEYKSNIELVTSNKSSINYRQKAIEWWAYKHFLGNLKLSNQIQYSFMFKALNKIFEKFYQKNFYLLFNSFYIIFFKLDKRSKKNLIESIENRYNSLYSPKITENKKYLK